MIVLTKKKLLPVLVIFILHSFSVVMPCKNSYMGMKAVKKWFLIPLLTNDPVYKCRSCTPYGRKHLAILESKAGKYTVLCVYSHL